MIVVALRCKILFFNNNTFIYYEDEDAVVDGLKKKHCKLTKKDIEKGINYFSIVNNHQTRTFNKSEWTNMMFKDNVWLPYGFSE